MYTFVIYCVYTYVCMLWWCLSIPSASPVSELVVPQYLLGITSLGVWGDPAGSERARGDPRARSCGDPRVPEGTPGPRTALDIQPFDRLADVLNPFADV